MRTQIEASPEPITVVDYNPHWPKLFSELKERITVTLGALAITVEHIGSTSVAGLCAKPIIDIDVVVENHSDIARAIELLATLGYNHLGDRGIPGREAFSCPVGTYAHHLYVCTQTSEELNRHLRFRNYLRAHPDEAKRYGELKKTLADRYRNDREAYTTAKTEYIQHILSLASSPTGQIYKA